MCKKIIYMEVNSGNFECIQEEIITKFKGNICWANTHDSILKLSYLENSPKYLGVKIGRNGKTVFCWDPSINDINKNHHKYDNIEAYFKNGNITLVSSVDDLVIEYVYCKITRSKNERL